MIIISQRQDALAHNSINKIPETSTFVIRSDNEWEQIFTLTKLETRKKFLSLLLRKHDWNDESITKLVRN